VTGKVRIKVCGVTHPDDAQAAVDAGVDLIGLNFVSNSPRRLDLKQAEVIASRVGGQIERVAVFRDAALEEIERILRRIDVERIQFHGSETPEVVQEVDLPVIKAVAGADLEVAERYPGTILLLDHPTRGGGQGQAWNWADAFDLIAAGHDVILAGGLSPSNVGQALDSLQDLLPWGVDVATGVEAEAHRKDLKLLRDFIDAVRKTEAGA